MDNFQFSGRNSPIIYYKLQCPLCQYKYFQFIVRPDIPINGCWPQQYLGNSCYLLGSSSAE